MSMRIAKRSHGAHLGALAFALLLPGLCAGAPTAPAAADRSDSDVGVTAKLSYDDTTGKYGLVKDTDIGVVSATLSYDTDNYSFDAVMPYIRQTGPGRAIFLPGRATAVVIPGSGRATGPGDVTAGITRYALNQEDAGIDLDLGAILKLNTASASKGLGTGKKDLSLQAAVGRALGGVDTTLTFGYTFVGKAPGLGLTNAWYGSLDGSYHLNEFATLGLTYTAGGTIVSGLAGSSDVTAYLDFRLTKHFKAEIYGLKGRTSQSPQHGIGGSLAYDF